MPRALRHRLLLTALPALLIACRPPAPEPAPDVTEAAVERATDAARWWQCEEYAVETRLAADGALRLDVPAEALRLPATVAASGARYELDGIVFHEKDGRALLTYDGEVKRCEPSERRSPWAEAADRGLVLRASGQEPGWLVEVGPAPEHAIKALLAYGEDQRHFERSERTETGFAVPEAGFEIRLAPDDCRDGMSGTPFLWAVTLIYDEGPLSGCGRRYAPR